MDLKNREDIEALAGLMEARGLTALELQLGENRLVLSRAAAPAAAAPAQAAVAQAPAPAEAPALPVAANDENMLKAPLVGNVYLAPGPGKPPFVAPGTAVKKGQTLCIIEAMKVMNEFPAPRDGVVAVVHVKNEQLVEYGQPLFTMQ